MTHPSPTGSEPDATATPTARSDAGGMDQGFRVLSSLIAGVLIYGALGWLGDRALHTHFLVAIGIVLGAGLGSYTTIRRLSQPTRDGLKEGVR